jgi:hypothetical protein
MSNVALALLSGAKLTLVVATTAAADANATQS